jgi:hypothetical protein
MKREFSIHKTLKLLSKQRVAMVLQPGDVWVIEKSLPDTETHQENLQTCLMRGWVEILKDSIPTGKVGADGSLPQSGYKIKHIYRLTDSGWNAIHRTHVLTVLSIIATLVGISIAL